MPESDYFQPHLIKANNPVQNVPELLNGVKIIACVGDSITYNNGDGTGYPSRLKQYLNVILPKQGFIVLNKGVSGEQAHEMLDRFKVEAIETNADLIFIFAGVNDVGHGFSPDFPKGGDPRGSSLDQYLSSIKSMIKIAKENNRKVVLITPPTIFEDSMHPADIMLGKYSDALIEVAEEEDVPVADVRKAFVELSHSYRKNCNAKDYLLTVDGVHPNSLGNKVITECVLTSVGISPQSKCNVLD